MKDILIGGAPISSKILKVAPIMIAFLFVIISLGTMPGTIGHSTKYVKKDDPESDLKLKDISIPVSLLSFTLLLLVIAMVLNMQVVQDKLAIG